MEVEWEQSGGRVKLEGAQSGSGVGVKSLKLQMEFAEFVEGAGGFCPGKDNAAGAGGEKSNQGPQKKLW